jgi:fermentation-respiration switch protein FrsA (DUF1100 family)
MLAPQRTNASAVTGERGPLRRLLDLWGFTPGFAVPAVDVAFYTRDGVRLVGSYLPGPGLDACTQADVPAVVLAHGFAGHRRKPAYAFLAEEVSRVAAVLAVDLRGHGASGGACTLGDRERLDVAAAGAWLRRHGHHWVGVAGASMGGTAALRSAGCGAPGAFDAVCAISAPAQWGLLETPAMRTVTRVVTDPRLRAAARVALRVRIGRWAEPAAPVGVVARLAPTPLLVVHGVDDHFYGPEQAELLYAAARAPKALWLEPAGFGHAEDGFHPPFARRLAAAVAAVHASGAWPDASA